MRIEPVFEDEEEGLAYSVASARSTISLCPRSGNRTLESLNRLFLSFLTISGLDACRTTIPRSVLVHSDYDSNPASQPAS